MTDLWQHLQALSRAGRPILLYGMGNGADKILTVCDSYGIPVADFFASDGFVRGHSFHGKVVLSFSQACEKYGAEALFITSDGALYATDGMAELFTAAEGEVTRV